MSVLQHKVHIRDHLRQENHVTSFDSSDLAAAYSAWLNGRGKYEQWVEVIGSGKPFDLGNFKRDLAELDQTYRSFIGHAQASPVSR